MVDCIKCLFRMRSIVTSKLFKEGQDVLGWIPLFHTGEVDADNRCEQLWMLAQKLP